MYQPINITEKVFYVGVNDRHKTLFENHIPIPQGVSVKRILPFVEKFGWEIVGSVEEKQALKAEKYTECYDLSLKIAEKINQQ